MGNFTEVIIENLENLTEQELKIVLALIRGLLQGR